MPYTDQYQEDHTESSGFYNISNHVECYKQIKLSYKNDSDYRSWSERVQHGYRRCTLWFTVFWRRKGITCIFQGRSAGFGEKTGVLGIWEFPVNHGVGENIRKELFGG